MKALIAVTSRSALIKDLPSLYSNTAYIHALKKAGADSLLLAPTHSLSYYQKIASICDGLLITGGKDIHPARYHNPLAEETVLEAPEIDESDFMALDAFIHANKPVLGICRGFQVINTAFGGTLYQHLPSHPSFSCCHKQQSAREEGTHTVTWLETVPGLCEKGQTGSVNSLHHQGIHTLAPGLQALAVCEDGLIEAVKEDRVIGVQWHPEEMCDIESQWNIFKYFLTL